ncbi:MAG: c-type cytochrome [Burkholderiales bacterium]
MKSTILFAVFLAVPAFPLFAADDGQTLSASCAGCHGTAGKSVGAMPPLAGLEKDYIVQQMRDFKSGKRPATIMHQLAKGYSDEQIEKIAAFLSSQKK